MDLDDLLLLREALDQPSGSRRDWLRARCGDDAGRRDPLLAELERAEATLPGEGAAAAPARQAGQPVGPFRLLRPLGRGGMGEVWLAERSDGFAQQVAIKWLTACTSPTARARFSRERMLLARLVHPGIARIVDGGESDGVPWYAMDYVDGVPLDRHVADPSLPLAARIALVRALCAAVSYAHAHLIVHRDLKPGNVLVTADGTPKLLDFGIAKLLDDDDALTETHAPMTLAYAAPEQFGGAPVTVATDVYALGAILYELACGQRPHVADSAAALVAAITTGDPPPPSRRLSESPGVLPYPATELGSDFDTLVLKALAREPDRRYRSVDELAADLDRLVSGHPIFARPASWPHRVRLWARRNRMAAALALVAGSSLVVGSGLALWQAARAERHATAAELSAATSRATTEAIVRLLAQARPDEDGGAVPSVREALATGSHDLLTDLAGTPEVRRAVLAELALIRNELGDAAGAIALLHDDVGRPERPGPLDLRIALTYATALRAEDRLTEAADWLDWLEAHGATAATSGLAGDVALERIRLDRDSGRRSAGIDRVLRREAELRTQSPSDPAALATALELHGDLLLADSRFREALAPLAEARSLLGDARGSRLTRARIDGLLAHAYRETDQGERAEALIAESLDWHRRVLGDEHPATLTVRMDAANLARIAHRYEDAEAGIRAVLASRTRLFGADHPKVAVCHNELALVDYERGRFAAAAEGFGRAQAIWSASLGAGHDHTLTAQSNRAGALAEVGDAAGARRDLDRVIAIRRDQHSPLLTGLLLSRGLASEQLGEEAVADGDYREALDLLQALPGANHNDWAWAEVLHGRALRRLGAAAAARPLLASAVAYYPGSSAGCGPRCAIAHLELSRTLADLGRPQAESLPLAEQALAVRIAKLGPDHALTREARDWRDRLARR